MAGDEKTAGDQGNGSSASPGAYGDTPAGSGQGETKVKSSTPENSEGELNPSAPGETGTTPGTNEVKK